MHNAPAVTYPVGRSALYGALLLALAAISFMAVACAAYAASIGGWRLGALGLAWLASCGRALRAWRQSPQGMLRWDGQQWFWQDEPGHVHVGLDVQRWVCVRWQAHDSGHAGKWLCLEPGMAPALWLDLRRALYSPAQSTQSPTHFERSRPQRIERHRSTAR